MLVTFDDAEGSSLSEVQSPTAKNPRELAGKLMDGLLEACRNHASDDMTVYVAGIWRKSESVLYA